MTTAGDAFGKAVGNERIGIYTVDDIRGFNPIEAGNARLEGLYFDQQDRPTPRLISGSTVRVGITAQGYPFPAPTGIVDYRLRAAGADPALSIELESTAYGGGAIAADIGLPLVKDRLSFTVGGILRRLVNPQDSAANIWAIGTSLAWRPVQGAVVTGFWSQIASSGEAATPTIFPAGTILPPRLERGRFLGQSWAKRTGKSRNMGVIAKLPLGGVDVEAGLFRSQRDIGAIYADLLRGTQPDGSVANRIVIADGNNLDDSVSGEIRLVRNWSRGNWRHHVYSTIRGRAKDRDFGGQRALALGVSSLNAPDPRSRPAFTLGTEDQDKVRQLTYGLGYAAEGAQRGSISVSLSKSDYSKAVNFANIAIADTRSDANPWLYSLSGSVTLTKRLSLYGGYVRGLEESLVAPDIAINRGEAPPAILTRQFDGGVRYSVTPNFTVVAGIFSVQKPYFAVDGGLRFGALGTVENRGIELSLAGRIAPGLSLVAGTVLLDSQISGEAVASGRIGKRPVGSVRRRSILNLDWKPRGQTRWSFDLAAESLSSRIGNIGNTLTAPARNIFALGTRYRFTLGAVPTVIRVQVTNLFNEYGWLVSGSGGFTYSPGRALTAQLVVDL